MNKKTQTAKLTSHLGMRTVSLLQQEQNYLLAYAYSLTHDYHLAEDIFQEVSLIVAEDPTRIPEEDAHARNWLREIIRRKSLELGRKDRRLKRCLSPDVIELCFEELDQDEHLTKNRRAAMADCIDQLKKDARAVITARYLHEENCERIARNLGRTLQSVYAILKRSRNAISECITRKMGTAP